MMPSALNTPVLLSAALLALVCCAGSVSVRVMREISETSGEELQDSDVSAERERWYRIAVKLHRDTKTLRDEQAERDFGVTANMSSYESLSIQTPLIQNSDGCLSRHFNTERCLARISSVLMWYKNHLIYIEKENLTSSLMNDVKDGTKRLLELINGQLQVRDAQLDLISSSPLPSRSVWMRKTVVHTILSNFTTVLSDTCRAIRKSKNTLKQKSEDRMKNSEWISDKNSNMSL